MGLIVAKEDYRVELVHGEEVMMAPASATHNYIGGNLHFMIRRYLKGKRCKVFYETLVFFDKDERYIPDLMIVCDKSKYGHIEGAPDLIIEILSPSTKKRDITVKKDTYERFGVKEYWIVNPADRSIEVYHLVEDKYVLYGVYHDYSQEEWDFLTDEEKAREKLTFKVSLYDDFEIDVREVFEE